MTAFANSLETNLAVTGLVLVMVFLTPWLDRRICRRLGVNLQGGVSENPRADSLLQARQLLLYAVFAVYLAAMAYIVFFSRSATEDYQIHISLYSDLKNAVRVDFGRLGLLRTLFAEGFSGAASRVEVVKPDDIAQVYMNIMLYVPMGYLLPYISGYFRARVLFRPAAACFLTSLMAENLQLVFRRGFYDMDDLVSNTIGGILGQFLFISAAYVVTHPDWRREVKDYRMWKRYAKSRTLYPFARHAAPVRATILASDEGAVREFYIRKLGFRPVKETVRADGTGKDMLLTMGMMELEVRCGSAGEIPPQTLTLSVGRLRPVIRRLEEQGITAGEIREDEYTGMQSVALEGPDGTQVVLIGR